MLMIDRQSLWTTEGLPEASYFSFAGFDLANRPSGHVHVVAR